MSSASFDNNQILINLHPAWHTVIMFTVTSVRQLLSEELLELLLLLLFRIYNLSFNFHF